jgi:ABC-type multidrug transport system fused ATPase/permease subunit
MASMSKPITQDQNRSALWLLRRLWPYLAPFRGQLACLSVVVLCSIPLNLITPLPLTLALDSVIGDRPLLHLLQAWLPPDARSSTGSLLLVVCIAYVGIALCVHLQSLTLWLLYETPPLVTDRPGSCRCRLVKSRGHITFRRVTFAYPSSPAMLRDVSFHIPAGTHVGIVGPS